MSRRRTLENFYTVKEAFLSPTLLGYTGLTTAATVKGGRVGRSLAMKGLDAREQKRFNAKYKHRLASRDQTNLMMGAATPTAALLGGLHMFGSHSNRAGTFALGSMAVTPLIAGVRDYRLTKRYLKEPRG